MRVRSTAVLALSTGSDRVVLAGALCRDAAFSSGRRGVARFAHGAPGVVLPLHDAAGMLPVDRVVCETPLLATALEQPRAVRQAGALFVHVISHWWALILLVVLIGGLVIGPRPQRHGCHYDCFESKADIAKLTVKKYAYEAYPQWRSEHPTLVCPRSLRAVDGYMDHADHRDPWGRGYVFTCGSDGFYMLSLGEDGKSGTADDIWSNQ